MAGLGDGHRQDERADRLSQHLERDRRRVRRRALLAAAGVGVPFPSRSVRPIRSASKREYVVRVESDREAR